MQLIKRLPVVVPIVLIAQLVFAATASAQPGGALLAAGNYHITTETANYFSCCVDPNLPTVSVTVTDRTTVAKPLVGPSTVSHETDVDMFACGGNPIFFCGGGCFIAGPTDFTGSGLSSAMLKTSYDPTTSLPCENRPVGGLPAFTVSVNWSGTGPVGSTRRTSIYSCAGYNAEVQTLSSNDHATASASFSGASLPTDSAGLGTIDQRWNAQGVAQDACQSFGLGGVGGKGAGPGGPSGPGGFEFASQSAQFSIPGTFGPPEASVSLFSFTRISRPTGTPPSTVSETDLTVFSNVFPYFQYCYVLQPPSTFSFGSGLSSAFVNASIDQNTTPCPNFPNSSFVPFTANLTWTATGPLASIQSTGTSDCGAFHEQQSNTDANNPATVSGTVDLLTGLDLSASQASIGSSDHSSHNMGVAPQGCILFP
jgi:hypothetical protein